MTKFYMLLLLFSTVLCSTWAAATLAKKPDAKGLLSCLARTGGRTNLTTISSSDFKPRLNFSAQNLRFTDPLVAKPYVIIIPHSKRQLQKSVTCSIKHGWGIRVRCGGHSYEGLSYTSDVPFVLIDLLKLNRVTVDTKSKTAWVEGGATLGEVYSAIAECSDNLAFPAGVCHTVGSGGHIAGGGQGFLSRKYGLAADNVEDVLLLTASGKVLDKKSMGKDVFWALRGGGGGSWGVVVAWKIRLVWVPTVLTAFEVVRIGKVQVTDLVNRWQYLGPGMEDDLFMRVRFSGIKLKDNTKDINASFHGIYLGGKNDLMTKIADTFPELGMKADDCKEMRWIESIAKFDNTTTSQLTNRFNNNKTYFKAKSDFSKYPLSIDALTGLWSIMEEMETGAYAIFSPLGGILDKISPSATPFPQRKGTLFDIQYMVTWTRESGKDDHYLKWMTKLYNYMEPHVSKSPRAAYVNYLDLDLGSSFNGSATVEYARGWGEKYFGGNYDRLVRAKTQVDPHNFFRNSQSIPPIKK